MELVTVILPDKLARPCHQIEIEMSYLSHLECSYCARTLSADQPANVCGICGRPLLARYDLAAAARVVDRDGLQFRQPSIWRYQELLPVRDPVNIVTLGEGGRPVLPLRRLGDRLGLGNLFLKDEGQNPTGSFKALGLAVAVSRALELGIRQLVIPTAGNAGGAMAAYASRAGISAHVFMPRDAPLINQVEVNATGADLHLVDGRIDDAGREAAQMARAGGWFDMSTLKEPYRLEGKKIMGYELAAHFQWRLPDVIVYPTGGGTGLVGMWKAFGELETLGWIDRRRPRMVAVQSEGCAPVVKAFLDGAENTDYWPDAHTIAGGLRVPATIGGRMMLGALRDSNGYAVAVSDADISRAQQMLAFAEGLYVCLESAATVAGLQKLISLGWVEPDEAIVLFGTGSGLKQEFSA